MFGHDDDNKNTDAVVQPMSTTPPDENLLGVQPTGAPAAPANDDDDKDISDIVDDINASVEENKPAESKEVHADLDQAEPATASSDLEEIKKSALRELSPLLDELNPAPEEKLDILIMTIQANDDQSLIPQAFSVAKQIEDKKMRAEAMLDIIQEINYFTKK